jgi:photosystem II stability/assembly factor-like uncharacterized protein
MGSLPVEGVRDFMEASDGYLYAATDQNPGLVYKSSDDGETWTATASLPGTYAVNKLMEASDGRIYAAGMKGVPGGGQFAVFWSDDGGTTWTDVSISGVGDVRALIEGADGFVYVGTENEGAVYRTSDHGLNWEKVTNWPDVNSVFALLQASDGRIYAGTGYYEAVFQTPEPCALGLLALGGLALLRRRRGYGG